MKRFLLILFLFCMVGIITYATQENNNYINSGEINNAEMDANNKNQNIKNSGEKKKSSINNDTQENVLEENSNISMKDTDENNKVEIPTIVLLILFGVLIIVSLILFIFKI